MRVAVLCDAVCRTIKTWCGLVWPSGGKGHPPRSWLFENVAGVLRLLAYVLSASAASLCLVRCRDPPRPSVTHRLRPSVTHRLWEGDMAGGRGEITPLVIVVGTGAVRIVFAAPSVAPALLPCREL